MRWTLGAMRASAVALRIVRPAVHGTRNPPKTPLGGRVACVRLLGARTRPSALTAYRLDEEGRHQQAPGQARARSAATAHRGLHTARAAPVALCVSVAGSWGVTRGAGASIPRQIRPGGVKSAVAGGSDSRTNAGWKPTRPLRDLPRPEECSSIFLRAPRPNPTIDQLNRTITRGRDPRVVGDD